MEEGKMMMKKKKEKRIVVAVDESEESMYALSWCISNLILSQNTTLFLLYVKPPPPVCYYYSLDPTGYLFAGDVIASMERYGRDLVNSVMRRAEAVYRDFNYTNVSLLKLPLKSFVPKNAGRVLYLRTSDKVRILSEIKVEKKVGTGDAKNVICAAVEKFGADILVMGTHDYGFFKRALLGSVSDHCARHVKCPVLVVKRPKNEPSR